jgi:hypothetical protein
MTCSKQTCDCKEDPKTRCIWWDEQDTNTESKLINAWIAGYYHAGYTHDSAYAEKMAREYVGAIGGKK